LSHLILTRNKIGGEEARALSEALPHCAALSQLNLSRNSIGNFKEGTRALSEALPCCATLSQLNLSRNNFGGEGTRVLSEVLPRCAVLSQLKLCCKPRVHTVSDSGAVNNIGEEGARALSEALPHCAALSRLDLSREPIAKRSIQSLMLVQKTALAKMEHVR